MPKRHIRYTRQQWQQLIKDQSDSGLSISQWCRQRDVGLSTFTKWKRRFESDDIKELPLKSSRFVELTDQLDVDPLILRVNNNVELVISTSTPTKKVAELIKELQYED